MEMKNMTLEQFCAETAGSSSVPGGGSVSALSGALAAALAGMVALLTVGKKGYEAAADEMNALAEKATGLRIKLLDDIQRDSTSFNAYMDAMAMPKETDEQKEVRKEAMQKAIKYAAEVPLQVAETALEIMPLARAVIERGNKNAVTDGLVAAMMSRTAVLGALYNVKINMGSIKDEAYVTKLTERVKNVENNAIQQEKEILALATL